MLLYHNRAILRLIFAWRGSVIRIPTIVLGLVIAILTWFLAYLIKSDSEWRPVIPHHYGIMVVGSVVSFAIVYRMNLGWQRYWEAILQQHFMYSKWADAYAQFFSFCQVSIISAEKKGGADNENKVSRINECLDRVERNFGLLSAMTAHRLTCGDIERMGKRHRLGAAWRDRVVERHRLRIGKDITGGTALPALSEYDFNVRDGGTGRTMSQNLDQNWTFVYRIKGIPSIDELAFLSSVRDRVSAVMYWILHDLSQISGDLVIAPPIQSRMYQELSNGMLGFNNSLKIADVPFPFPYAQLLTWMLIAFSCFMPFYLAVFTESLIISPIAAFFAFVGIWSINEVAIELENPFGSDINDISVGDFHERFLDILIEQRGAHQAKMEAAKLAAIKVEAAEYERKSGQRPLGEDKAERNEQFPDMSINISLGDLIGAGPENVEKGIGVVDNFLNRTTYMPKMPDKSFPVSPADDIRSKALNPDYGESDVTYKALRGSSVGALDASSRLIELSTSIDLRLTEILKEVQASCKSRPSTVKQIVPSR